MKNRNLFVAVLLLMLIELSSCVMHYDRASGNNWHANRTSRHWGRERHMNTRHAFWGKHKYGMRPHNSRGHFRD